MQRITDGGFFMKTDIFQNRKYLIIGFIAICFIVILIRLFTMQVLTTKYINLAKNNAIKNLVVYPARGEMYDRTGKLMVSNNIVYDVLITPKYIDSTFDVIKFCNLINMDTSTFNEKLEKCRRYSRYKASVIATQISKEDFLSTQELLYQFPGIYYVSRTVRQYPFSSGAHILGDVGEVDASFLEKHEDYSLGDYHGVRGLEFTYEKYLKGQKGFRAIIVNSANVEVAPYNDGKDDVEAIQGADMILEIDNDLQCYGEKLMANKRGSIVAIDPNTGGILAMVSAPGFDPNMLVGRERSQNYLKLLHDSVQKPLINRAVSGVYPPGSTFKTFNGLVALQTGVIDEYTQFTCNGPASSPIKCTHNHQTPLSVVPALRESCNPFFRKAFEEIISHYKNPETGLTVWNEFAHKFGFGVKFNTDIFSENPGMIPDTTFYNKWYGKGGWKSSTIRSLSIGQGEIQVTPIQLANLAATIGNEGTYIKPHLVKAIIDHTTNDTIYPYSNEVVTTGIEKRHFDTVKRGMRQMASMTGSRVYLDIPGVEVCGKTGTAQNSGKNHALFISFAPMYNPKIAIAVIVENSGYGATFAVPVAAMMIEHYLNDSIDSSRQWIEKRVLETTTIE